jgi:hypothetical protein
MGQPKKVVIQEDSDLDSDYERPKFPTLEEARYNLRSNKWEIERLRRPVMERVRRQSEMQDFPERIQQRSKMQEMPDTFEAPNTENESGSDNDEGSDEQPIRRSGSSHPIPRSDSSSCDWIVRKLQNQIEQEFEIKKARI